MPFSTILCIKLKSSYLTVPWIWHSFFHIIQNRYCNETWKKANFIIRSRKKLRYVIRWRAQPPKRESVNSSVLCIHLTKPFTKDWCIIIVNSLEEKWSFKFFQRFWDTLLIKKIFKPIRSINCIDSKIIWTRKCKDADHLWKPHVKAFLKEFLMLYDSPKKMVIFDVFPEFEALFLTRYIIDDFHISLARSLYP